MVKQVLTEQRWMFNEMLKQEKANIYKERSYNHTIIQSISIIHFHIDVKLNYLC